MNKVVVRKVNYRKELVVFEMENGDFGMTYKKAIEMIY